MRSAGVDTAVQTCREGLPPPLSSADSIGYLRDSSTDAANRAGGLPPTTKIDTASMNDRPEAVALWPPLATAEPPHPFPPSFPTYLAFHLTLPTHAAHATTSSLRINLSILQYSLASSSLLATRCTKLWHARHSHATLFSRHSSCQPRFTAFACICFGIR